MQMVSEQPWKFQGLLQLRSVIYSWVVLISEINTWLTTMFYGKTVRYRKTLFYHMIDVAVVNAFVLYNHLALLSGCRTVSENDFRDELVRTSDH